MTSAMLSHSIVDPRPKQPRLITSLSMDQEIRSGRQRISYALANWRKCYFEFVPDDVRALYHFCRLYHLLPSLHLLPTEARKYSDNGRKMDAPEERRDTRHSLDSSTGNATDSSSQNRQGKEDLEGLKTDEAIGHAWLVYDHTRRASNSSIQSSSEEIYLPIITFLAALCVWKSVRGDRSGSNVYGSTRVLQLFKMELQNLPWECCCAMADCLDNLT